MNIAIVSAGLSTHSGLRAPIELAKALKALGHQITFYALSKGKDNPAVNDLRRTGIRVSVVNARSLLTQILILKKKLEAGNHDIISAHCFVSQLLAARLTGIPVVWTYYGTQLNVLREHVFPTKNTVIDTIDSLLNLTIRLKTQAMAWLADEILSISNSAKQELKKLYGRKPFATVPLGSAPPSFTTKPLSLSLRPTPYALSPKIILSVSRITPYKGFHLLIRVVNRLSKRIPDLKLVIVGSAPLPRYLSYLKKISGSSVEIIVNPSDAKLGTLFRQAKIYATADEYLFYGLPIWEASSFGIPSVALKRKAASEAIVHGKTGFLAKNEADLEEYLERLLTNPKLCQRMGEKARELASHRTWGKTARSYEGILRQVLTKLYLPLIPTGFYSLMKNLQTQRNLTLADLGSDTGMNLKILGKLDLLRPIAKLIAVDIDTKNLKPLAREDPKVQILQANLTSLRRVPKNSVNTIICTQVIEHIENQQKALSEIARVLKPGGKLFLSSVAKKWYGLYWHNNKKGKIVVHPDHVHEFSSVEEFIDLIQSSGLTVIRSEQLPGRFPLFDYFLRAINLLAGKPTSAEHRDFYLKHPRLIRWHKHLSFLPIPGYSIVEALAQKPMREQK